MAQPNNLKKLQERFWNFITAPEGVEATLKRMKESDPESVPVGNWIDSKSEEAAIERLDVYANMYFFRILDVLKEDFEYTCAHLGNDTFHNLATDYLLAHPSTNPSLRFLGRHMESFVRKEGDKYPAWLADLVCLEWNRADLFDAEDFPVVQPEDLQTIPAESWGELSFKLIPALRFLELNYPVDKAWLSLNAGEAIADVVKRDSIVITWRQGFFVRHCSVSLEEYKALKMLQKGDSFGAACESFLPEIGEEEEWSPEQIQEAVQAAYKALVSWVQSGFLQSFSESI